MSSKIFKINGDKVVLCEFSGEYVAINQFFPTKEVTKIYCSRPSVMPGAAMFFINDPDFTQYYVWYNRDNAYKDPAPGGKRGIQVNTTSQDTKVEVAQKTATAINEMTAFTTSADDGIITVTCVDEGDVFPPADYNTNFYIDVETQGCYTVTLYNGRLWKDCNEIKDVILHDDGSMEVFFTLSKTYVNKLNRNSRYDVNKEFFMDNYRVIPAGWITYLDNNSNTTPTTTTTDPN